MPPPLCLRWSHPQPEPIHVTRVARIDRNLVPHSPSDSHFVPTAFPCPLTPGRAPRSTSPNPPPPLRSCPRRRPQPHPCHPSTHRPPAPHVSGHRLHLLLQTVGGSTVGAQGGVWQSGCSRGRAGVPQRGSWERRPPRALRWGPGAPPLPRACAGAPGRLHGLQPARDGAGGGKICARFSGAAGQQLCASLLKPAPRRAPAPNPASRGWQHPAARPLWPPRAPPQQRWKRYPAPRVTRVHGSYDRMGAIAGCLPVRTRLLLPAACPGPGNAAARPCGRPTSANIRRPAFHDCGWQTLLGLSLPLACLLNPALLSPALTCAHGNQGGRLLTWCCLLLPLILERSSTCRRVPQLHVPETPARLAGVNRGPL